MPADPRLFRREKDLHKVAQFSDAELMEEARRPPDPVGDEQRRQANIAEVQRELSARGLSEKQRAILQGELDRLQADAPSGLTPMMNRPAASNEPPSGLTPIIQRPDVTASPAQDVPGAPQFVGTPEGAATGIERLRRGGLELATSLAGPSEKRLGIETAGAALGAAAGSPLGVPGAVGGEMLGTFGGSLLAEFVDPSKEPLIEAGKTALTMGLMSAGLRGGAAAIRFGLGKPSVGGRHLMSILEAEGKIPTAGAVLEGSLARNMQAIGSSDAFMGQRLRELVEEQGGIVTQRVRDYISGYQRFYGGAKEGFKMVDNSLKSLLPGNEGRIVEIDRGVLDKLKKADQVWASEGAAVDFPLRSMLDEVKRFEATLPEGQTLSSLKVSLEQAEAVRQLLHQRANALSGTARTEGAQAAGEDVARAVRDSAYKVGDDIESAIDLAIKDGRISPTIKRAMVESKDMWKSWKQGEAIQEALVDSLKKSQRSGEPITSDTIFNALSSIDKQSRQLKRPIITKDQEAHLVGMAKALQANEKAQHATQFTMAVRAGQLFTVSSVGAGLATGKTGLAGAALSMTLIPAALGWAVSNPKASALLIRGLRLPAGSAAAVRTARQLATLMADEGFITPPERVEGTE